MNLHLYAGKVNNSSRIFKETESIRNLGLSDLIIITATSDCQFSETQWLDQQRCVRVYKTYSERINFRSISKIGQYVELTLRIFFEFSHKKIDAVNSHSLYMLVCGALLKKFGNVRRLIYDPHELETERAGLGIVGRFVNKWLERFLMKYVDHVIVVCEPIGEWYIDEYDLKEVTVIRNVPKVSNVSQEASCILRNNLGIKADDLVFIYQGILSSARGVFDMIQAFQSVAPDRHIVFMGFGDAERGIIEQAKAYPNIHFHPAVSSNDIVAYTSGADVGLNFIAGKICESYALSLPNKFFEYVHAGCCVLVSSNLKHLSALIRDNNLGWSIQSDQDALRNFIISIEKDDVIERRESVQRFASENCWKEEEQLYEKVFIKNDVVLPGASVNHLTNLIR